MTQASWTGGLLALLLAAPAAAATPDESAALATAEAALAAFSAGDAAALSAITIPEGWTTGTGLRDGRPFVARRSWAEFIGRIGAPGAPKLDEWITGHHVRTDGDIAMVWGDYTLTIDGRFSHCGIDHFDLVRQDGRWKVLNLTWSQRTIGCAVTARARPAR